MHQPAPDRTCGHTSLEHILARFDRYHPARIDLTLERIYRLLDDLGNPQRELPPVIHVAGTNGKGSTIAFLRAICAAAGLAVSAYTSPHLLRFSERFVLAGQEIGMNALCDLLLEVDAINAGKPITEFEIVTAAAFVAMARTPADVVLLETGLGGRYDATNVIERPLATIITPVSLDHQEFLGADIATIAGEKAAIQKAGVRSIIAPQVAEAEAVIERIGREIGAELWRAGYEWRFSATSDGLNFCQSSAALTLPLPALPGTHQIANAATAVACLLGCPAWNIGPHHIAAGLRDVAWPGRLQRLRDGALFDRLPTGSEIWLDAGHNGGAGLALAEALRHINAAAPRPLHIVFAMLEDKDPTAFLEPLADFADTITAVPLDHEPRGHDPAATIAALDRAAIPARRAASLAQAVDDIAQRAGIARILICGSHGVVAAALRANGRAD